MKKLGKYTIVVFLILPLGVIYYAFKAVTQAVEAIGNYLDEKFDLAEVL